MQKQKFQSALPRGERRQSVFYLFLLIYFNPRSRVGSDITRSIIGLCMIYFNPRSRVGSDVNCSRHGLATRLFQSALPRGERPRSAQPDVRPYPHFNPRSRVGSDQSRG